MRFDVLIWGTIFLIFSVLTLVLPEYFNVGSIIGLSLVLIAIGIFDKDKDANSQKSEVKE